MWCRLLPWGCHVLSKPVRLPSVTRSLPPLAASTQGLCLVLSCQRGSIECPSLVSLLLRICSRPCAPRAVAPLPFAAARAAFVRVEIKPASSSATAAICWSMKRPVGPSMAGRSAKRTSTPASSIRSRKPTERVSRSTFATTRLARCRRAAVSAASKAGLSLRRPLSTSVNSARTFPSSSPRWFATAALCASRPKPDWPCLRVDTR
ncbi:hypothetical protein ACVJF1_003156 [Bradyrhizobium diazoefficiens]